MKITFYGGAGEVTGSNYLLEIHSTDSEQADTRILVDCGLMQGSNEAEKRNFDPFLFDPRQIDAVLITHAHIDHTGRLPKLYKDGFRGQIYSTGPTKDVTEQLLLDSEHLLKKNAEEQNLPPLYDINDINDTMRLWKKISYHEKFKIKDTEVEFYNSGHILGSAFIVVEANNKKIVFSGDLGNMPAPLVKDTEKIPEADYVLVESAYGNRIHEAPEQRKDQLEDIIEDTVKDKGTLLIPAFAMERTQEILYELNDLAENGRIPGLPIFVDSPLAIKLTGIYEKYSQDPAYVDGEAIALHKNGDEIFDFPRLRFTLTTQESKEINQVLPPKVIIAGSGMSHGGRILHHEFRYLPDPNSYLLFIGYQAHGTLGRKIIDGVKSIKLFGEEVPVRCKVRIISGYSAHADQPLLLNWIEPLRASVKKVFVVQGEEEQSIPFAQKIRDEFAIDAVVPKGGESYDL